MNKIINFTTLISVALAGAIACTSTGPREGVAYIAQTTGIEFPAEATEIDVHDSGSHYIVAYLKLSSAGAQAFVSANGYVKNPNGSSPTIFVIENLAQEHRTLPSSGDFFRLTGRSESNRWESLVDRQSGGVWVSVLYPDAAGSKP